MIIFQTDNYNRDDHDEQDLWYAPMPEAVAVRELERLKDDCRRPDAAWYRLAFDDEKPFKWEP